MKKRNLHPFLLTLLVFVADVVSKIIVVETIPEGTIGKAFFGDFLWLVHVRNNAVAFSFGESFPLALKYVFFVFFPILILLAVGYAIATSRTDKSITLFQKWCLAGILGGGLGNMADRLFRSLRVVDWISVKFYGILGWDRFPTWNIGDSCVVVCVGLLMISLFLEEKKQKENKK